MYISYVYIYIYLFIHEYIYIYQRYINIQHSIYNIRYVHTNTLSVCAYVESALAAQPNTCSPPDGARAFQLVGSFEAALSSVTPG